MFYGFHPGIHIALLIGQGIPPWPYLLFHHFPQSGSLPCFSISFFAEVSTHFQARNLQTVLWNEIQLSLVHPNLTRHYHLRGYPNLSHIFRNHLGPLVPLLNNTSNNLESSITYRTSLL